MTINSIAVIGAGAVGGFYGAKLQQAGYKVQFLSSRSEAINKAVLSIKSIWGDFAIQPQAFSSAMKMGKADLIILATKAVDIDYKTLIEPLLQSNSILMVLQNGINQEEGLRKLFPNNVILGALAFTCINRLNDYNIIHIDYGLIKIAPLQNEHALLAKLVAEQFNAANVQCSHHINLRQIRYEKLVWNVPFNSLSVICNRASTDMLLSSRHTEQLILRLMNEIIHIANADGVELKEQIAHQMIERTKSMIPYKTSMLVDYEHRREMEVEAILGEPLRIGLSHKQPCATLHSVYHILSYFNAQNSYYSKFADNANS